MGTEIGNEVKTQPRSQALSSPLSFFGERKEPGNEVGKNSGLVMENRTTLVFCLIDQSRSEPLSEDWQIISRFVPNGY